MKKADRRVKYTKMVLRQSLLALLKDKPINKITVKQLCEMSDINRGTFYSHYYDVYDLLEQIEGELYQTINKAVASSLSKMGHKGFMKGILQVIADNSDLCKVLFSEYGNRDFIMKIINIAKDSSIKSWGSIMGAPEHSLEYIYTFMANGIVGVLQTWVQGGFTQSVDEISQLIETLNGSMLKMLSNGFPQKA